MAITLGDVFVRVRAEDDRLSGDLKKAEDKARSWSGKVGGFFSNALSFAADGLILGGVGAVTSQIGGLVSMTSDAEEMMGKFDVVFGDFAQDTAKDLDAMARTMGRSKYELRGFAASFQDTFVPLGFAREDAAELSKKLTELTVDVASFNNVSEADAARDFQSALVGNTETVRKYGIIITQAALDQELLNMGIKGGVKDATEAEKVQARLNLILKGTTDAQGDAVRTSASWENQVRALKAAWNDFVIEIGMKALPIITPLLAHLTKLAQDVLPLVITKIDGIVESLAGLGAVEIITKVLDTLENFSQSLLDWSTNPETQKKAEEIGDKIADYIVDGIAAIFGDAENSSPVMMKLVASLKTTVKNYKMSFQNIGEKIAEHIFNGLEARIAKLDWVKSIREKFQGFYDFMARGPSAWIGKLGGYPGYSEGGYAGHGMALLGEKGREFVLNADTTRALEARLGTLNQQNVLGAVGVNGTLNVNFGGNVPQGISPGDIQRVVIDQVGGLFQQHAKRSRR